MSHTRFVKTVQTLTGSTLISLANELIESEVLISFSNSIFGETKTNDEVLIGADEDTVDCTNGTIEE